MTATHWKDPSSYVEQDHMTMLNASSRIPANGTDPWLAEDPCIYRDKNGHYHTLTHHMWHCSIWASGGGQVGANAAANGGVGVGMGGTCGGHGYSADGLVWYYSGVTSDDVYGTAYGGPVQFTDGGSDTYARRERPQMVLSTDGTPVAITTSVQLAGQSSHTQAVPLRTGRYV